MRLPPIAEIINAFKIIGPKVDDIILALENASPDVFKPEEEIIRKAVSSALEGVDLEALQADLTAALEVAKKLKGIVGPGVGPNLVP